MMIKSKNILVLTVGLFSMAGCSKFLEPGVPGTELVGETVYSSDELATASLLGIYASMESEGLSYSIITSCGICSDECLNYNKTPDAGELASNNITTPNGIVAGIWSSFYKYIYVANSVIEGINNSHELSPATAKQLMGEALFVRAFCHLYLAEYFGNVPYVTSTNLVANSNIIQQNELEVIAKVVDDLIRSKLMLSEKYLGGDNKPGNERVRPNKYSAMAILSRAYLILGDWGNAVHEADSVISATNLYELNSDLDNVFLKNNSEAIWQLMAVRPGFNSYFGGIVQPLPTPNIISLHDSFVNSFDTLDQRRTKWVEDELGNQTYYFPFKFKIGQNSGLVNEYTMVIRLAELYLIRAEGYAHMNKLAEAVADLNQIRVRAGLPNTTASNQNEIIDAIHLERRHELFCEFGDRWFDLKRSGSIDSTMIQCKGQDWDTYDQLLPIPETEILRNSNLVQNPGY